MRKIPTYCILLGVLCVVAAIGLTGYNLWDDYRAGRERDNVLRQLTDAIETPQKMPEYLLHPEMEMPTVDINGHPYIGILSIPDLELLLPVMDSWSYPNLKIAPCRYSGSAYQRDLVIAAHNYDAHFGRLNRLKAGSEVVFTDVTGNRFAYKVAEVETLAPTAVEDMTSGDWDLTLFTCTVGGRTRVTVRCTQEK